MRYFLHLAYRGTAYRGWQRQSNAPSVQAVIEEAISHVLGRPMVIGGCGRTDAEVHARQFFAQIEIEEAWDYDLSFRINKRLPRDIALYDIIPVSDKAHARYDATSRTYDYFFHRYFDPFLEPMSSLYIMPELDLSAMQDACSLFEHYHDFVNLCRKPDQHNTTICHVTKAQFYSSEDQRLLRFEITADRYLMSMVRLLMHQLLEIGQGRSTKKLLEGYLNSSIDMGEKIQAYPQGLYLSRVVYPYLDLAPATDYSALFQQASQWQAVTA